MTRMSVAYAVSVTGLSFGYNGAIVLMRDTFNEVMVKNGIPAEYSDALNAFVSDPMHRRSHGGGVPGGASGGVRGASRPEEAFRPGPD